jgi:quaternary ammonium compound-resistance protein SugE
MVWLYLLAAGAFEIVWAFFLKQSDGFTRPGPAIVTLAAMAASFGLLSLSMRSLPLGTAYAIWTGIGALGAFVVGIVVLGEQASLIRIAGAAMIAGGLVVLKLSPAS